MRLPSIRYAAYWHERNQAVPYAGGTAMQQDLITGRIHVYFDAFNSALRFHRSGQTRLLATTGSVRSPSAPEIPTVQARRPGV